MARPLKKQFFFTASLVTLESDEKMRKMNKSAYFRFPLLEGGNIRI